MIEEPNARERRALEGMAACPYRYELRENLGPAGAQTLANLGDRGWAVGGLCPVQPESHGWAITELGQKVLDACYARERAKHVQKTTTLTPQQCRAARELLSWTAVDLAVKARCTWTTIQSFEEEHQQTFLRIRYRMRAALEAAGVIFVDENGAGPGVRLRRSPS